MVHHNLAVVVVVAGSFGIPEVEVEVDMAPDSFVEVAAGCSIALRSFYPITTLLREDEMRWKNGSFWSLLIVDGRGVLDWTKRDLVMQ